MDLAVLKYQFVSGAPVGIPAEWPAEALEIADGASLPGQDWVRMTPSQYATHRATYQSAYDTWWATNNPGAPVANIERRFYKSVNATSTQVDEYVVANGKTLILMEVGGNASSAPETSVKIIWDYGATNDVLFSTHGDGTGKPLDVKVTGNGTKKLAIVLTNDQNHADILGGYWIGAI